MRPPNFICSRGSGLPMTPMIDVVFQLIVFFAATSTIAKNETAQAVELPVAERGKDRDDATQKRRITANVLAGGDVQIAGRTIGADDFAGLLRAELAEHTATQIEVQFRADRGAPYGAVQPLLVECARAGVWQVNFAVKREGGGR